MVFEDLHWADDALLDFIDYLMEWSRDHRLFVLTMARPELLERRPDWGSGRRSASIHLEPLPADAMGELLCRASRRGSPTSSPSASSTAPRACRSTRWRRSGCSWTVAS